MTDVARLAGVSHQTVSRVLNGYPYVSQRTRSRVLEAVTELGYRPNKAARALVTGRSNVVGVISQSATLHGPAAALAAFTRAAVGAGYAVSVEHVAGLDPVRLQEAVNRHLDQRVVGLVVIAPFRRATELLIKFSYQIPLVCIDGDHRFSGAVVAVDQEDGGYTATNHLLDAGHPTVWHVAGPPDWLDSRGRIAGWRRALTEAGAEIPPVISADWSAAAGYRAGQLLARLDEVTAVFAANDHLALGVLRALHERGRTVPHDVSLVGFDDVPEAGYYIPPLTTMRPDFDAVAATALELLLDQVRAGTRPSRRETIPPRLVTRASVAARQDTARRDV
ncbi:LacI family DNA-binding transcriptional regulator [Hamadaea tsunoensis]|uniref:LacI family DNA-binding transcriptional regulator n=1 Tax=Hamadaea tsunoensis TaxID=53368 RepID=UPI00048335D5|nr:LacI family DNA-binding transcriptional regulator [Hamadaea tsunoensis]